MSGEDRAGCGFLDRVELDALLAGTLPPERRRELDSHAEACGACALLFADAELFGAVLREGPADPEREEFERSAPFTRRMLGRRARGRGKLSRWAWPVAAAAALLLAVVALTVSRDGRGDAIVLADGSSVAVDAMPFSAPPTVRGDGGALADRWAALGEAYGAADWSAAAARAGALRERADSADAALYEGIARLKLGRYASAEASLREARAMALRDALPTAAIDWFLALALLGGGDVEASRATLARAGDGTGFYAERARALLARLQQPR